MKFEIFKQLLALVSFIFLVPCVFAGDGFIENVAATAGEGEAKVSWNIVYDSLPTKRKLIIRYLESNITNLNANPNWKYSKILDPSVTSYTLKNLSVEKTYSISVGVCLLTKFVEFPVNLFELRVELLRIDSV